MSALVLFSLLLFDTMAEPGQGRSRREGRGLAVSYTHLDVYKRQTVYIALYTQLNIQVDSKVSFSQCGKLLHNVVYFA